ncbi:MAG: hypothetical protein H0V81_06410 [Solirubrobacterales bacterium]|nr:hypothetical protein [Solirubrobacterales bacterium]
MSLQPLVDAHAILAAEQQRHLADVIGERAFAVDLATGRIRFGGELTYDVELLGSEAPGPGTWMWGWANPSGFNAEVTRTARALRELGRERGWPAFTKGEVPLDGDVTGPRMAIAGVGHAGAAAHYGAPLGGGGRAYLLLHDPGLALPPPDLSRLVTVLSTVLQSGEVEDWPAALGLYAGQRGLALKRRDETMLLSSPELAGHVRVSFDDLGRVSGIKAVAGGRAAQAQGANASNGAGAVPGDGGPGGSEPDDNRSATRRGLFSRLRPPV